LTTNHKLSNLFDVRLGLFPDTTRLGQARGQPALSIAGCDLSALADQYGTPLYLYDRQTMDTAVRAYRQALTQFHPGRTGLTYAGKAFLCTAIAQWAHQNGLRLDCTGAGELRIAANAGLERSSILVHGVYKTPTDLQAALEQAGTLVVDNLEELHSLIGISKAGSPLPELWLRLRPGIAIDTHTYTQTGQLDSKFGMSSDEANRAVQVCLREGLPVTGLHFHLGSHFQDLEPLRPALEVALDLISMLYEVTGWMPQALCPGGGWGIAYHEDELPHPPVEKYVRMLAEHVKEGCQRRRIPLPDLILEPGRSLIGRAGVALYRVGAVKLTDSRRWLLLDGGLADNPRPALYRARYTALPISRPDRPSAGTAWIAGPYCETGDILIEDLPMPALESGELVAVPVSGAYQLSMSSNYNGARKPAVLLLEGGQAHLIQDRETLDDLIRRDLPLP
jgi:diaminopimelate decarboxylase